MAETASPDPARIDPASEEAEFYHRSALIAAWTGSRLAIGGMSFLFAAFVFSYFYLRALNSNGRWLGPGYHPPSMVIGTFVMMLVLISAALQYTGLQQIRAGRKRAWQVLALVALFLGLGAVGLQIAELATLPFLPGSSGFSSVFVAAYPVFVVAITAGLFWLETLVARSRRIATISFVEQPPTIAENFEVQRFQANLSAFTLVWNYLAVIGLVFWFIFYALP